MDGDKNPPNGTPPLLNLQNVQINTEPNCPAAAVENALSEIRIHPHNLDKADHGFGFATFRNPATFFQDLPRKIDGRSVLSEGFSIREYVAKVRSVDIRKCWPLSESLLQDSLREGKKPPLPPLVRPNYRWWSCHPCLEMFGEHKHFGVSLDKCNSLSIEQPEDNSKNVDHIIEQQLTVSLDTDPETGPGFSQDLDEQIRKLSTVKISGQDLLNISRSEDAIKNIENKNERVEEHGRNIIVPSCIKDGHSKIQARKFTSVSEGKAQLERLQKRVKADRSDGNKTHKEPDNQTQTKNSTFDLIEREGELLNGVGGGKEKVKATRAPDERADQAVTKSGSLEFDGSKIDKLDSEITKIESRRHNNFDIGNSEGSGVKICPVCTTFTSATITAVNAHMDNCLAQVAMTEKSQVRMQKQKLRTGKKRSIVDICAASPPVQTSLEYLDNFQMDGDTNEAGSQGMDANSNLAIEVTASALREGMDSIQTGSQAISEDDSSTIKCKRKHQAEAHYSVESGKFTNGDRQRESVETKRRRQRLGTITCVLGSKDLKARETSHGEQEE